MATLFLGLTGCEHSQDMGAQPRDLSSADAPAILEAAIDAHGDRADFAKLEIGVIRVFTRGIASAEIEDLIVTTETYQFPDFFRRDTTHQEANNTMRTVYLRCGSDAWESRNDDPYKRVEHLEDVRSLFPFRTLNELRVVRRDGIHLERLKDDHVEGDPVHVLRFEQDGQVIAEVSFDAISHLVRRIKTPTYNPKLGRPGQSTTIFKNYRQFFGLAVPEIRTTYMDGELFSEMKLLEFRNLPSIPIERFKPTDKENTTATGPTLEHVAIRSVIDDTE